MSRHIADRSRTGIRVRHLEGNRSQNSEISSILSVSGFIEDSLMSRPSIFGSQRTPQKQRRKIFDGRSKSPPPVEVAQQNVPVRVMEEQEIVRIYDSTQPIKLPDPLGISSETLPQVRHGMPEQLHNGVHHYQQPVRSQSPLQQINRPLEVGSLQHFLKQPQQTRQEIMESMIPSSQIPLLNQRLPSRPVMLRQQPPLTTNRTEERPNQRQTAYFPPECFASPLRPCCQVNRQQQRQLKQLQAEMTLLRNLLSEKERSESLFEGRFQELQRRRQTELQLKDAEISRCVIEIDSLKDALKSAQNEVKQAQQTVVKERQYRALDKASNSYLQYETNALVKVIGSGVRPITTIQPVPERKPASNWSSLHPEKVVQLSFESTHSQQSYLSPLSINTSRT